MNHKKYDAGQIQVKYSTIFTCFTRELYDFYLNCDSNKLILVSLWGIKKTDLLVRQYYSNSNYLQRHISSNMGIFQNYK